MPSINKQLLRLAARSSAQLACPARLRSRLSKCRNPLGSDAANLFDRSAGHSYAAGILAAGELLSDLRYSIPSVQQT